MNALMRIPIWVDFGVLVLVGGPLCFYLMYAVHVALEQYGYIPYAKRYCRRHGLAPTRWRCRPEFKHGLKTESSIVELQCQGRDRQEHVVELLVWFLGVRAVLRVEPPATDSRLRPTVIKPAARDAC